MASIVYLQLFPRYTESLVVSLINITKEYTPIITLLAWPCYYLLTNMLGVAGVFKGVFNAGAIKVKLVVDEVGPLGAGDTAYERSHYTFYNASGEVFDEGK